MAKTTRKGCGKDVKVIRGWQRLRRRESSMVGRHSRYIYMGPKQDKHGAWHPQGADMWPLNMSET